MPTIEIKSCSKTPNYCALEAVIQFIRNNYQNHVYQNSQVIKVESGRVLRVEEEPVDLKEELTCDCSFTIINVEENNHERE